MKYLTCIAFSFASILQGMTLDETISYSLEHNSALQQASVSVERLQSLKESRKAQNFGRVNLLASYDHYNNTRTLEPLTPMSIVNSPDGAYKIPTTKDLFNVGISYNVVLFDGFAQQSSYKISDLQHLSGTTQIKLGREELIYNVRNIYLSLLGLQEQKKAQELYISSQQKLYENIHQEYKLGSKSKLELLRASSNLEESRAKIATIESNITILKATLTKLMGDKEFDKTKTIVIHIDDSTQNENTLNIEKTVTSLQRYEASKLQVQMSQKKKDKANSTYYPTVDFSAYYGQNFGPNDTQNVVPPTSSAPTAGQTLINEGDWNNAENWQVGVHLKWNVLDFGISSALSQEAQLSLIESKLQSDTLEQDIKKNIITAQSKIKLSIAEYKNALSQYRLLDETEKIELIRYENEALSLTDLLETKAKKELVFAQMINAKYNYQRAIYYLDYLLENGEEK